MSQQLLDQHIPRTGPSWGGSSPYDGRHRRIDAIRGMVKAGDSAEAVAEDYDIPVELVRWLVRLRGRALGRVRRVQ